MLTRIILVLISIARNNQLGEILGPIHGVWTPKTRANFSNKLLGRTARYGTRSQQRC